MNNVADAASRVPGRIRVLIVDDSAVVRAMLKRELAKDPAIEVVGAAPDPYAARDKIVELNPDVLTLDVEMPKMDGITFLHRLMRHHPMPVVILSSLTARGTQTALDALSAGAVEVLCKAGDSYSVNNMGLLLAEKIKAAALARVRATSKAPAALKTTGAAVASQSLSRTTDIILAIGASTGGVQALSTVLPALPADSPGVLVVQHMPERFTASFADRLNGMCRLRVKEAAHGDTVLPGRVLIAPGGHHMVLRRSGAQYFVEIIVGPEVFHQRPSVDVMFDSVARFAGRNAIGAILTGMGEDGAAGLLQMRQAGAHTIAESEDSCVVFGMPAAAIKRNAAAEIVAIDDVAGSLVRQSARLAA